MCAPRLFYVYLFLWHFPQSHFILRFALEINEMHTHEELKRNKCWLFFLHLSMRKSVSIKIVHLVGCCEVRKRSGSITARHCLNFIPPQARTVLASARWECKKESEKPLASQVAMNSASETDKHITRSCSVVQLLPMCRVCDWRMKYLREASRRARPYEIVIMREKQIKIKITRWQNRWKKIKRGIYTEIPWMPHYNGARVHVDVNRHSQRNQFESEEKTEIVCRKWKMFGSIGIWCVYCCRMAW